MESLKSNLSKYNYSDSLIKQGFQRTLSIPQRLTKTLKNCQIKTTFNPNNPNIYSTIKSTINCLKNNSVNGFFNMKLIQSKHQPPNLKKLLNKAEYGEIISGMNASMWMLQLFLDKWSLHL